MVSSEEGRWMGKGMGRGKGGIRNVYGTGVRGERGEGEGRRLEQ